MSQRSNDQQNPSDSESIIKMNTRRKSDRPAAIWTDAEQATIVNFLCSKIPEGGDLGTFDISTMRDLVLHLEQAHPPPVIAKDLSQVEGKWKKVSHTLSMIAAIN